MRALAITGIVTTALMPSIISGSLMRATPPSRRMSAGTRSSAMTALAPASSATLACSGVTTSMITPPLSISARPRLTRKVPGTADFAFPFDDNVEGAIEGYANTDSARRGDNVRLFVSSTGTHFTVEAFRFGHYGGAGARRVWAKPEPVVASLQAPPVVDPDT